MNWSKLVAWLAIVLLAGPAAAQTDDRASVFTDKGYGKKWLGDFFPYQLPHADDLQSALGHMLGIYNTGILVLGSIIALYSFITFVVETAHHGKVGGRRHSAIYAQFRLVIAIGLLTPVLHGYNAAQIIIVKMADAGSGLANSLWAQFPPLVAATDFTLPLSYGDTVSAVLQKALISETCIAAVTLDQSTPPGAAPPSVTVQPFFLNAQDPAHDTSGAEVALPLNPNASGVAGMTAEQSLHTEALLNDAPITRLRLHYNRSGYDDYCGAIDFPVPTVPTSAVLKDDDQTLYIKPFFEVRPTLARYGASIAAAVADRMAATKKDAGTSQSAPAQPPSPGASPPAAANNAKPGNPAPAITDELPQASMSVSTWDGMVQAVQSRMADMADRASKDYVAQEEDQVSLQPASTDWVEAGSLFFKMTKLAHDNVRLRNAPLAATLPNAEILPEGMRGDRQLASCAPVLESVFLADYHCRTDGRKTMLAIKVAYNLLHAIESQRGQAVVPAIDGAAATDRKEELLSTRLFSDAGLDGLVAEMSVSAGRKTVKDEHSAMFDAVNAGNMLMVSTSGLFQQASLVGQQPGGTSQSMLLTLFAILLVVPAFFLSIVLPLLPAVRFFIGIAAWLLTVFEAMVIFPLVVLGNMSSEGEGLLAHGRQGYVLLLQMMLRPVLMVFGIMAALVIFDVLYNFITWAIWSGLLDLPAASTHLLRGGMEGVLELTGYLLLWTFLVYLAANLSFRAITMFPDRALRWMESLAGNAGSNTTTMIETGPTPSPVLGGGMVMTAAQQPMIQGSGAAPLPSITSPAIAGNNAHIPHGRESRHEVLGGPSPETKNKPEAQHFAGMASGPDVPQVGDGGPVTGGGQTPSGPGPETKDRTSHQGHLPKGD